MMSRCGQEASEDRYGSEVAGRASEGNDRLTPVSGRSTSSFISQTIRGSSCIHRPPRGTLMPVMEMPHMPCGTIVVLNGPSSAGKSTLAKYLCENLSEPHLHVELDAFRNMEPANYWEVEKQVTQVRVAALCRAINATASTFSRHGQAVIVDHVLSTDAWRYMLADLADLPVLIVGVFCSLEILIERELIRRDRRPDWPSLNSTRFMLTGTMIISWTRRLQT